MEKKIRLRKKEDFSRVYNRGISAYNNDFKIIGRKNETEDNRYGFSISKKFGKAVERNFTKRRLKEIIRTNENEFLKGFDFIIIPRNSVKDLGFDELKKSLFHCVNNWNKRNSLKRTWKSKK